MYPAGMQVGFSGVGVRVATNSPVTKPVPLMAGIPRKVINSHVLDLSPLSVTKHHANNINLQFSPFGALLNHRSSCRALTPQTRYSSANVPSPLYASPRSARPVACYQREAITPCTEALRTRADSHKCQRKRRKSFTQFTCTETMFAACHHRRS